MRISVVTSQFSAEFEDLDADRVATTCNGTLEVLKDDEVVAAYAPGVWFRVYTEEVKFDASTRRSSD